MDSAGMGRRVVDRDCEHDFHDVFVQILGFEAPRGAGCFNI
jgi:hypothetical protein